MIKSLREEKRELERDLRAIQQALLVYPRSYTLSSLLALEQEKDSRLFSIESILFRVEGKKK